MACYLVTPQDNEVAKFVEVPAGHKNWTGRDVARLRGMYETQKGKPLDISDPAKAAKILAALRGKLLTTHIQRSTENMVEAFRSLHRAIPASVRYNRIRMLATMFSGELDKMQLETPEFTRQQLANGIKDTEGVFHYGAGYIFDRIYRRLRGTYAAFADKRDKNYNPKKAEAIATVLDNFGALCAYTKASLRDTEGIKLGSRINYAAETTSEDFGDNDLSVWFDPSENTKEAWQEATDMTSAFSSLSGAVRRILSTLRATDEHGNYLEDDLGCPIYINPVTAHQALLEDLGRFETEDELIAALKKSSLPFAGQLLSVLKNNNQVRTIFFGDLYKCFQAYGDIIYERGPQGVVKTRTRILNKLRNLLTGKYTARVKLGKTLSANSVYDENGNINWANIWALRNYIYENFVPQELEGGTIFQQEDNKRGLNTPFGKSTITGKANMLMHVSNALGIDLDSETALKMAKDKDLFYKNGFVKSIRELVVGADGKTATGIDALLTKADMEALTNREYDKLSRKEKKFLQLFKAQTATQARISKQGNIQEVVNQMLDIVAKKREAFRIESRVHVKDSKGRSKILYSHVTPSYMGTFIERLNGYAYRNDKQAIQQFIRGKYLDSSMFITPDGRILNRWLQDLYTEDFNGNSLAETMTYQRFLGSPDTDFENFTSKKHALAMMHEYFFADNLKDSQGRKYANYPVFILGDSGVSKFIRAKRYSSQEILDGMYDIFLSEIQRNRLLETVNNQLKAEGKKPIDNTTDEKGNTIKDFKMLPFLNDSNYITGDPNTWTKAQVQSAIQSYMKDAVAEFKTNIGRLGLLDKIEVPAGNNTTRSVYQYFNDVIGEFAKDGKSQDEALDTMLANYYWNTKFATLQQFQLMTIDVAFYKDTKDLQKRYKEIHAPGRPASIQAKDFDGNYYCGVDENGNFLPETCCYFNDPQVNAELSNPEFMSALLYQYAQPEHRAEVQQAIKDGILVPKENTAEESARNKKLKEILGGNFDTYDSYRKNALADGQGYRTLRSYRKIMGMLGKWTREMENAYTIINDLQAQYGEDGEVPAEVIDQIAELAVVFQPIKPYMFTIEKYKMNDNGGVLNIPVQHKYAEAVLIPALLPAGSMARHMALWMDRKGIDLVGADKIVKVGGYGSTSFKNVNDRESLEAALEAASIHKLNYQDYREQTNVPEHINSSRLFGTQLRKLIMAGLDMDKDYSSYMEGEMVNIGGQMRRLTGRNLVDFYNSLIVANILDSYDDLAKEVEDPNKLASILQQAIINNSRQSLDNLLAFAMENGNFALPLFEGGMEHDTAAMLMSIFKDRVNKQKILGGAAVQVSAMGIKGYEESGDLAYVGVDKDGNIVRSTDPDYADHPAVNIKYAEIEVPWNLTVNVWDQEENNRKGAYVSKSLKFSDYCNSDGTLKTDANGNTLIEKRFPGILDRVLYRIPTERDYSMIRAKIVRFSPEAAGGTIKVPAQGTTQAGFDFDIDKLYFHMREFYIKSNKFADTLGAALASQLKTREIGEALLSVIDDPAEYDPTKSCLDQDENPQVARAVRNNMLLTLIEKRLEDPETFKQRTQPGGFADYSRAARIMRELQYGSLDGIVSTRTSTTTTRHGAEIWNGYWTREQVAAQTDKIFLFGDNTDDRVNTHYVPRATQAVIRGLPNAIGIDTKKNRGTGNGSYFIDADFDTFKAQVDEAIQKAKDSGKTIVIPADGIGTGKAMLAEKAPKCFAYLQQELDKLKEGKTTTTTVTAGKIDFAKLQERAKDKKSDPEPNYDPSDPFTIITYNQMNQAAGKLIGIFANQNTNHAFASLMSEFKLKKPLSFCEHSYNDLLHAPKDTDPALNIAECLSASVDAVKDPVLNYLNFNTITADAAGLLARLGYTGFEIGLLFNQTSIREACDLALNEGVTIDVAIAKMVDNYTKVLQAKGAQSTGEDALGKQTLANMILEGRRISEQDKEVSGNFAAHQLKVLKFFKEVLDTASEVSDFVTTTKFTASNSVGSTFGDMYAQQMRVKKYITGFSNPKRRVSMKVTKNIFTPLQLDADKGGKEAYLNSLVNHNGSDQGNPFAYEQAMYDMNVRFVRSMAKYFPYETRNYCQARNLAASLSKTGTLDAETINDLHSEMLSYILALQDGDFNGDNMHIDIDHPEDVMTNREYYLEHFPERIAQKLEENPSWKKEFAIFEYMLVESQEVPDRYGTKEVLELKLQDVGGLSPEQKDAVRDSWAEIAESPEFGGSANELSPLARDLFLYCYYKAGFEFSPKSFMHLAPVTLKEKVIVDRQGTTYKELLDRILEGENAASPVMIDQIRFAKTFIADHVDNYRFTYKVRSGKAATELDKIITAASGGQQMKSSFTVTADKLGENTQLFIGVDNGKISWIPAIRIGDRLFIADRRDTEMFNVSSEDDNSMTYTFVGNIEGGKVLRQLTKPQQTQSNSGAEHTPQKIDHSESVPVTPIKKESVPASKIVDIVKAVAKAMLQRGELMREDVEEFIKNFSSTLSSASNAELQEFLQQAKQTYGELKDDNGNTIC